MVDVEPGEARDPGPSREPVGKERQRRPGAGRPSPGVYEYAGYGSEQLSLPPLSQAEGHLMPGTVSLLGSKCWVFRIDYSTHHWQTWKYCLHDSGLWEAGGQSWQLWSVGPLQFTNLSSFSCAPASMTLPADASPGERWESRCTGVNTSVKGRTMSAGPYRFVGLATMSIGGTRSRRRTSRVFGWTRAHSAEPSGPRSGSTRGAACRCASTRTSRSPPRLCSALLPTLRAGPWFWCR